MDQVVPLTATAVIAERMRELRTRRRWSAQRLAEEMTKVGVEWNRGVVTKLENNRRESVSVTELMALALVLDVPPLAILLPREDADIQITPQRAVTAKKVGEWLIGPHPLPASTDSEFVEHPDTAPTRQEQHFADWPVYLRRPATVPEVEERATDLNRQLAERQDELQRLLAEVNEQRHQLEIADAERTRRRERRWVVERDLITLMERRRMSEASLMAAHRTLADARGRLEGARRDAKELKGSVDADRRHAMLADHAEMDVRSAEARVRHLDALHYELLAEMDKLDGAMKALDEGDADGS